MAGYLPKPPFPTLNKGKYISNGIVGSWPMYEGSGLVVNEANEGESGAITGAVWSGSKYGQGVDFSVTADDIQINSTPQIENIFVGGGTISAAIHPRSNGVGAGENNGRIASKNDAAGWIFYVGDDQSEDSSLLFLHDFSGGVAYWAVNNVFTGYTETFTVSVTYDNSSTANNPIFYIDGIAYNPTERIAPSGTAESDAGQDLYLGNRAAGEKTFDGIITSVTLWDRILPPDEAALLHHDPFAMYRHSRNKPSEWAITSAATGFGSLLGTQRNKLVYGG